MIRCTFILMGYTILAYVSCDPFAPIQMIANNISDPAALFVMLLIIVAYLIIPLIVAYGLVALFLGRFTPHFWLIFSAATLVYTAAGQCG